MNGSVLWANLHLLFWLSLVPFLTAWMARYLWAPWPIAIYGADLLMCAIAYFILTRTLISLHGASSQLALAIGNDVKGTFSLFPYIASIPLAFYRPSLSYACFILNAVLWMVPDRRIERSISKG